MDERICLSIVETIEQYAGSKRRRHGWIWRRSRALAAGHLRQPSISVPRSLRDSVGAISRAGGVQIRLNPGYIGSVYHKRNPSFAGRQPKPRPDASLCPSDLSNRRKLVESWLQDALASGNVGRLDESGYPRLVWYRKGNTVYEARTGSKGSGEYHGYPLRRDEHVMGLQ